MLSSPDRSPLMATISNHGEARPMSLSQMLQSCIHLNEANAAVLNLTLILVI